LPSASVSVVALVLSLPIGEHDAVKVIEKVMRIAEISEISQKPQDMLRFIKAQAPFK